MNLFIVFVSFFLSAQQSLAGDNCDSKFAVLGYWFVQRVPTMADGCVVQVTPIEKGDLTYREYVFDQSGRWTVFNSMPGDYETSTSMRTFFLLPQSQLPDFSISENQIIVTLASGDQAFFKADQQFLFELRGSVTAFSEKHEIDLSPGGNFEITHSQNTYVDAGWSIGGRSYKDSNKTSQIVLSDGSTCVVENSKLFQYKDPMTKASHYQPIFLFRDLQSLESALNFLCNPK